MIAGGALPVLVTGVAGRMGATIARLVREAPDLALVAATERKGSPALGVRDGLEVHDDLGAAIARAAPKVVIDFTSAEASVAHARACAERGVALVVGSTGFSADQRAALERCAKDAPLLVSPNMSIGVNVVVRLAAELARRLGDGFDVEIVEAHHRMKKDAPSGTALRLAEEIALALGRAPGDVRTARQGQVGERPAREIGVQSVRGGDVVGEHTVLFLGDGERVELSHRATNRDLFARGALRAARWIAGRPAGLYGMQDVLEAG